MARGWRSPTYGMVTTDQMIEIIRKQVETHGYHGVNIFLATDGQVSGRRVIYETALVVRLERKGAFFFTWGCEMKLPPVHARKEGDRGMADAINRLPVEATISRAVADLLTERLMNAGLKYPTKLTIALDVNPDERFRSSRVLLPCQAMVAGYNSVVKPESGVIVSVANRENKRRRERNEFTARDVANLYFWVQETIRQYDREHGAAMKEGA